MKKTLLTTTMLAAIATMALSGNAFAHHPLYTINPELYERIDTILSTTNSQHNEMVGDVEDYVFMGQMEENAALEVPTNQSQVVNGDTSFSMTINQGLGAAPGFSTAAQTGSRTGARVQ